MGPTILLAIFLQALTIDAYNILILHPFPSFSHQQPMMVLIKGLVERGHRVYAVTPNEVTGLGENYTYVDMSFAYKYISRDNIADDKVVNFQKQIGKWEFFTKSAIPIFTMLTYQYQSEEFKRFQRQTEMENTEFDVVIGANHFIPYVCGITRYLSRNKTTPPIISFSTHATDFMAEQYMGAPFHASFTPSVYDAYNYPMNLWEKIENWYSHLYISSILRAYADRVAREFFIETYGSKFESLADNSFGNVSLLLVASNSIYYYPRQLSPNVIELGPLHIKKEPEKLPQTLQEWCDGAEKGVIYFSLGSNMRSKNLDPVILSNLVRVFGEMPVGYRVVWKWELDERIPGQPDNVLNQKWVPQQSILAHPKIKLFITQGGLQSYQEAVHYGVPIVGIPWFSDQEATVAQIVNFGLGARLRPPDLYSHEEIKSAIHTVLMDKSYSKNMRRRSAISRDFTPHSLDKAIFWVEHVAEHDGASHLRPSTADSTLFEYFCFDILSVILAVLVTSLYLVFSLAKIVRSFLFDSSLKIKKRE